jgi:DNA-binding CsgD family transcriptional regulator
MVPAVSERVGTDTALIEREHELELIDGLLREASGGRGVLALAEGEAGIGKSALLAAARARARSAGLTVLAARGHDAESAFAFGGCLQLFEPVLAETRLRERLLVGAADLARPLLDAARAETRADRAAGGADRIFGLLHGLYWLTANLSEERPLMLALDDAQWLDEPSLRFLRYLAVRIDELPVALLVAWRSGEPAHAAGELSQLAAEPGSPHLRLGPLSTSGVAQLVREEIPGAEPQFCDACAELTGGNPLYVAELIGAMKDAGMSGRTDESPQVARLRPRAVAASVLARIARRGPEAAELARAVAVAGEGTALGRAGALAGLDPAAAAAAADALGAAGVLAAEEPLSFVHPLVRAAVYDDIPSAARARRHGDAARLLQLEGADPELVAAQLLRAPGMGEPWAVDVLRLAGRRALDRGVPDGAVRYLRRALDERPARSVRGHLLAECGFAARLAGAPDAFELLERAIELIGDGVERARLIMTMGQTRLDEGRMSDAAATFERGLAELAATEAEAPEIRSTLWAGREICGRFGVPSTASVDELDRLLAGREPAYDGERSVLAFIAFQRAMALEATCGEVRELARRALGDGRAFTDGDATRASVFVELALTLCEDHDVVTRVAEETRRLALVRGSVLAHATASHALAAVHYRSGRLSDAVADATAACEAVRFGWELHQPSARATLAEALLDRGEIGPAAQALDVPDAEERWGGGTPYFYFLAARARLAFALGRPQDALDGFRACDRMAGEWGARNPAIHPWRSGAALAALRLGDIDAARGFADDELADARAWGAPRPLGIALRTQGLIEGDDLGIELLQEAVAELDRSPSPVEQARALIDLGGAMRRSGRRQDARAPLRRGLDLALRRGAHALAARARDELRAAGARPRRLRLTGADALTPMERRTAALAAQGLSNREVAQNLFLTVRTIEMHLTHSYRKLGITSRTEIAEALRA